VPEFRKIHYIQIRASLTHEHLKSTLLIGTIKFEPNVEEIASAKHFRT
jgi:hypothetical protein